MFSNPILPSAFTKIIKEQTMPFASGKIKKNCHIGDQIQNNINHKN